MKILIIITCTITLIFSYGYSQEKITRTIPLLKENVRIDSLIDEVLASFKGDLNENIYFVLDKINTPGFFTKYEYFIFSQVFPVNDTLLITDMFPVKYEEMGYFKYKNCVFFVYNASTSQFSTKKKYEKQFFFEKDDLYRPEKILVNYLYKNGVFYKNLGLGLVKKINEE